MRSPVWLKALLAQVGGVVLAGLAAKTWATLGTSLSFIALVAIQAVSAVTLSLVLRLPRWWMPVQALFLPMLLVTRALNFPPALFLAIFVLLWLSFRSNTRERVPLYLSNRTTWRALAELLPQQESFRFIDLGCGLGGTLAFLADERPNGEFHGVESAPLPYLISRLRTWRKENVRVRFGDIWRENLSPYDAVYAFLSPAPMPTLWGKARGEMRKGTLLISNSFEIPGVKPDQARLLDDARGTRLLIWKL